MRTRQWSDEKLTSVVAASTYMSEALRMLGLSQSSGNYKNVNKRISELGLSRSHWMKRHQIGTMNQSRQKVLDIKSMLVLGSSYRNATCLKRRILQDGLLSNRCAICGQSPEWQGRSLVLVLDHINGVSDDHRLENLRMLCPNCNSQQDTFAGRNKRYKR